MKFCIMSYVFVCLQNDEQNGLKNGLQSGFQNGLQTVYIPGKNASRRQRLLARLNHLLNLMLSM